MKQCLKLTNELLATGASLKLTCQASCCGVLLHLEAYAALSLANHGRVRPLRSKSRP